MEKTSPTTEVSGSKPAPKYRRISRRTALTQLGVVAASAAAAGVLPPQITVQRIPEAPKSQAASEALPDLSERSFLKGKEKEFRIEELDELIDVFSASDERKILTEQGLYDPLVLEVEDRKLPFSSSIIFSADFDGERKTVARFGRTNQEVNKMFSMYTDLIGEDKLEDLAEATKLLLAYKGAKFYEDRGDDEEPPVDDSPAEFLSYNQPPIAGQPSRKLIADIPLGDKVLKHPELNDYYQPKNYVVVNPDGRVDFCQVQKLVTLENKGM